MNSIDTEENNDLKFFNYQKKLLLKEIDTIQGRISNYDDLSFKIKGWAITLWAAICVWGAKEQRADIVLIGIFVVFVFWIMDGYFKFYQRRSMVRMGYIEDFLNNRWDYEKEGLKEAFKKGSFGEFIIYDPIGRVSKDKSDSFKKYYKFKTALHRNFLVSNLFYLYSSLMFIGFLILMFLLLEIFSALIISISLFVVLLSCRIIYKLLEKELKRKFSKNYEKKFLKQRPAKNPHRCPPQ